MRESSGPDRHDYYSDRPRAVAPRLQVTLSTVPETAVIVHLDGEVDQDTRRFLDDALAQAISDHPPLVIVDLAGLAFCYSSCLNALIAARLDARAAHVEMVLAAASPQTTRLLELTGTDQLFAVHGSVRAALADAGGFRDGTTP
ncbi:hypothetical protein GCM10009665_37650 [Kitasatospora nipponensis]|uniref:STAS domain-containing protein n=1 Tax=Kitasatospora nipponensis TaxID=258049 RepID=A0ABN1WHA7_9ACTN